MPNIAATITNSVTHVASLDITKNIETSSGGFPNLAAHNFQVSSGNVMDAGVQGAAEVVAAIVQGAPIGATVSGGGAESALPTWEYLSDDGQIYAVHLSVERATGGGLVVSAGGAAPYPARWQPRKIFGRSPGGAYNYIVVAPDHALFPSGDVGTFSVGGTTYTKTSSVGEKRRGVE